MKTNLIKIGNSQGIRIPKPVIRQCRLDGELDIEVKNDSLVIRAAHKVRQGWNEAFREMAKHGDDDMLLSECLDSWDEQEWEWK